MDVSHETKLERFVELLLTYNKKINLIGRSTEQEIWQRHIYDCAQLKHIIGEYSGPIVDIGSGAGLPGIVLGCYDYEIALVEKNLKKSVFLKEAIRKLNINGCIYNDKIENISFEKVILFVSRATMKLGKLIFHVYNQNNGACGIFLKGENYQEEIKEARKDWDFDVKIYDSITSPSGKIIKVTNIEPL